MQKKSSIFVNQRFLNKDLAISELKKRAERIKTKDKNIREISLFGSLSREDFSRFSDADILIILEKDQRERIVDRIPEYLKLFLDAPMPVDIFPYTEKEIKNLLAEGNRFIKRIMNEKIVLAE